MCVCVLRWGQREFSQKQVKSSTVNRDQDKTSPNERSQRTQRNFREAALSSIRWEAGLQCPEKGNSRRVEAGERSRAGSSQEGRTARLQGGVRWEGTVSELSCASWERGMAGRHTVSQGRWAWGHRAPRGGSGEGEPAEETRQGWRSGQVHRVNVMTETEDNVPTRD